MFNKDQVEKQEAAELKEKKKKGWRGPPGSQYRGGRSFMNEERELETKESLGKKELLSLFRKVKPLTKEAMSVAAAILRKQDVPDSVRLQTAQFVVKSYVQLVQAIYDSEDIATEEEKNTQPAAILRLHVKEEDKK